MKLYRYMSLAEFSKMLAGVDITGKRDFKARTASEGVCFLAETTVGTRSCFYTEEDSVVEFSPEWTIQFLEGIVTNDVLVEFETQEEVEESWGIYADPLTDGWYDTICINEYCVPSYNRDTFIPLRYALVDEDHIYKTVWYPVN